MVSKQVINRAWPAAFVRLSGGVDPWFDRIANLGEEPLVEAWRAPLSLWEDEKNLYVAVEMPGVAKDDIDVTLDQGKLRIVAERKAADPAPKYLHNERLFGRIQRVIRLPETLDYNQIEAQLENGVLEIRLNKKPEVLPKKIEVKTT